MGFWYYSRMLTLIFAILGVRNSTWHKATWSTDWPSTCNDLLRMCGMSGTRLSQQLVLVLMLLAIWSWQTEYKKMHQPLDALTKDILRHTPKLLRCMTWLLCASVAPLFYWPELNHFKQRIYKNQSIKECKASELTPSKRKKKMPKFKEKCTEMSGIQNKRMRAEIAKYDRLQEKVSRHWQDLHSRTKHLQLKYTAKRQHNTSQVSTQRELISASVQQRWLLQHQLVVLETCIPAARAQLQSYRYQNKTSLHLYEKIYQQTLALQRTC